MTGAPDAARLGKVAFAEAADLPMYLEIHADGWRFQPRVAAVFVWQGHVLLQGALDGGFWVLPGGRLLPLELTADGLVRTMRWEIGQEVTVQRLLWVMEYVTPIGGQPVHELGFYYATDLPVNSPFLDPSPATTPAWNAATTWPCAGSQSMLCRTLSSSRNFYALRCSRSRTAPSTWFKRT